MENNWVGKIENDDEWLKHFQSVGKHLMGSLIIPIIVFLIFSFIIGFEFVLLIIMIMFLLILFLIGLLTYIRKSYGIGLHIFINKQQKKYWLDQGNLKRKIIDLLKKNNITFTVKDKFYLKIFIELPNNLRIWVNIIKSKSKKLFKSEFLLMIQLGGINLDNSKKAKEIQKILDTIRIKSIYKLDNIGE